MSGTNPPASGISTPNPQGNFDPRQLSATQDSRESLTTIEENGNSRRVSSLTPSEIAASPGLPPYPSQRLSTHSSRERSQNPSSTSRSQSRTRQLESGGSRSQTPTAQLIRSRLATPSDVSGSLESIALMAVPSPTSATHWRLGVPSSLSQVANADPVAAEPTATEAVPGSEIIQGTNKCFKAFTFLHHWRFMRVTNDEHRARFLNWARRVGTVDDAPTMTAVHPELLAMPIVADRIAAYLTEYHEAYGDLYEAVQKAEHIPVAVGDHDRARREACRKQIDHVRVVMANLERPLTNTPLSLHDAAGNLRSASPQSSRSQSSTPLSNRQRTVGFASLEGMPGSSVTLEQFPGVRGNIGRAGRALEEVPQSSVLAQRSLRPATPEAPQPARLTQRPPRSARPESLPLDMLDPRPVRPAPPQREISQTSHMDLDSSSSDNCCGLKKCMHKLSPRRRRNRQERQQ